MSHQVALIFLHSDQVALIDQKLDRVLVELVGRVLQLLLVTEEELYRVVVIQLQNPIELSL